jgi:4a-hydroxytetrahydrobiopterin dehydratase
MTETLARKKCTPCRGGVPRLTLAEAEHFRSQTPNLELRDDGHRIEQTLHFSNFRAALDFVRDVGDSAETEAHHPDVSFGGGYATISLRTKKIKGLHENDFIMASKVDRIFDGLDGRPDRQ